MFYFPTAEQMKRMSSTSLKVLRFKIQRKNLFHLPIADDAYASAGIELELRKI